MYKFVLYSVHKVILRREAFRSSRFSIFSVIGCWADQGS